MYVLYKKTGGPTIHHRSSSHERGLLGLLARDSSRDSLKETSHKTLLARDFGRAENTTTNHNDDDDGDG